VSNINIAEQIKDKLDIAEVIRQYVPNLKRAGKTYKACCPFHKEKTPSFTCNSDKGFFYCFGCQTGGDIFDFVMKMENIPFNEALEKLAAMAGVEYQPQRPLTAEENRRATLYKLLDAAQNYYHKNLFSAQGQAARTYVKGRHLTKETCQQFELGLSFDAPGGLAAWAQQAGYKPADLTEAGLCRSTDYGLRDYFRRRLMFPIWNQRGNVVGFGGRILGEGEPKYLNSPETILFTKSHVLYGLNFAGPHIRKADRAVLLEGYMDVIGCHQAGVNYTVAPLGTSLTEQHARLLKRYTENVIVLFDPDAAGIKAALRGALILVENGFFVKVASLPDGLDPDEYIIKYGKEAFEQILNNAQELIAFHTQLQLEKYPQPLGAQQKTHIVSELAETIAKHPDEIVRREWAKYVAEHIGVEEQLVLARLNKPLSATGTIQRNQLAQTPSKAMAPAEEELLAGLIQFPSQHTLCTSLTQEDFSSSGAWALFKAVLQAAQEGRTEQALVQQAAQQVPEKKNELFKLALRSLPAEAEATTALALCVKQLQKNGLQRQLKAVQQQMKQLGAGNVPPELFQQYMQLQTKLKK